MTAATEPKLEFSREEVVTEDNFVTQTTFEGASATYSEDVSTLDTMRATEASGALDFWNDPEEDVYSNDDGEPA